MKRILLLLLSPILVIGVLTAQSTQVDLDKIDRYLEKTQKIWQVPGMSVGIVKDNELVFSRGYGLKEEGKNSKPDGNTLYAVASNSKAFTSAAIAILVQQGKLNWNDRVLDYLPYFRLYDEYVTQHTTIRDLLSHRTGLGTFSGDIIWYRSELEPDQILERASALPKAYDFRAGYGYNNLMYVAAGQIIEAVSGKSWDEFIKQHFLDPLGMNRSVTTIRALDTMQNVAIPHALVDEENIPIEWTNWDAVGPMGGLISSVEDMSKWVIFNLNHGIWQGDTILTRASRNTLWTLHNNYSVDHTDQDQSTHFRGYGLGWGLSDYHGYLKVGHSGGYDGMITYVQMIPDLNLGVIVLTNGMRSPIGAVANYIIDAYVGLPEQDYAQQGLDRYQQNVRDDTRIKDRKTARVMNTTPSLPLTGYTGTYYADIYGDINITIENGKLAMSFEHTPDFEATLEHWHYDVWKIEWKKQMPWFSFGTVQFNLDHQLNVTGLTFDVPNDDIWFHELKPVKVE